MSLYSYYSWRHSLCVCVCVCVCVSCNLSQCARCQTVRITALHHFPFCQIIQYNQLCHLLLATHNPQTNERRASLCCHCLGLFFTNNTIANKHTKQWYLAVALCAQYRDIEMNLYTSYINNLPHSSSVRGIFTCIIRNYCR